VGDGDLPQPINRRGPVEGALPHQQREPPGLPPIFGELGVGDGAPCRDCPPLLASSTAASRTALNEHPSAGLLHHFELLFFSSRPRGIVGH
jgi:hypothetical protein